MSSDVSVFGSKKLEADLMMMESPAIIIMVPSAPEEMNSIFPCPYG